MITHQLDVDVKLLGKLAAAEMKGGTVEVMKAENSIILSSSCRNCML